MSIKRKLINLANHLDSRGLTKEADYLDRAILKYSQQFDEENPFGNPEEDPEGPLTIQLPEGSTQQQDVIIKSPIEEYDLRSKGFDLEDFQKPYDGRNMVGEENEAAMRGESMCKQLAEESGHVYIEDTNSKDYDSFSRRKMINGKPGMMCRSIVEVPDIAGGDPSYQLILKTYNENGKDLFYHRLYTSQQFFEMGASGAMLEPAKRPSGNDQGDFDRYMEERGNPRRMRDTGNTKY